MNLNGALFIAAGATLGAFTRYGLTYAFNSERLPWGTLLANLLGGYLIGFILAMFSRWPTVSPEMRLGIVTGFLGALTTFSTFSAEVVDFLASRDYRWGIAFILFHVGGTLIATVVGVWSFRLCCR